MPDAVSRGLEAGQRALETGRFTEAAAAFAQVRDLLPRDVSIAIALANVFRLADDMPMARATLLAAHAGGSWTDPSIAFALAAALLEAGAPQEATACFTHVVTLMPNNPAALGALAGAMRTMGDPAAGWPLMHRAITKAPADPALLLTAAQLRHDLGDPEGALRWLDRADAVRPNHAATQRQRAYTLLLGGASAAGWRAFEARPLPIPATGARAWNGESLRGESIVVTAEQGVGDQFQFVRFVSQLVARGATRVVVECHADAVSLLVHSGLDAVARGAPPDTDWHVPMLSLPHRLELHDKVLGDRVPYLRAPDTQSMASAGDRSARRIGLVWAGNPSFVGRVTRDLDPALVPAIVDIPGIEWVALQHGDAGNVSIDGLRRIALPSDWSATADALASLDGLVTTDTGIAHLAGAMGIPTWVMLQHVPDWRWGLHGNTTPWYPSARLVRQPHPRDWRAVVDALRHLLMENSA